MKSIVHSPEDSADALKESSAALASIAFSSAYCPMIDPDFNDIIPFAEFTEVFHKVYEWSVKFEERLKEIKGFDEKDRTT